MADACLGLDVQSTLSFAFWISSLGGLVGLIWVGTKATPQGCPRCPATFEAFEISIDQNRGLADPAAAVEVGTPRIRWSTGRSMASGATDPLELPLSVS
jgi:hypothetical protein